MSSTRACCLLVKIVVMVVSMVSTLKLMLSCTKSVLLPIKMADAIARRWWYRLRA